MRLDRLRSGETSCAKGGREEMRPHVRRHGVARAMKDGPRRSWRFGAALTPRKEDKSMRKAECIEALAIDERNPCIPARAGEEA